MPHCGNAPQPRNDLARSDDVAAERHFGCYRSRMRRVFVTGGTGYIGRRLIPALLARGHDVSALARPGREAALPPHCKPVVGDALDARTYQAQVAGTDTLVHLVGVAHPSPAKAAQFVSIDLASARAALAAALHAGVAHFVYLSVAQPAPVMRAYLAARAQGEALIRASGLAATFLRPWYVIGPGHRWPLALLPGYWVAGRIPKLREAVQRLGLVRLAEMVAALVAAVENPPAGVRVVEVPAIRAALKSGATP
jgi:uncharacterized protein YbjT (DUF2867 family)